jgi:hypothetical protein
VSGTSQRPNWWLASDGQAPAQVPELQSSLWEQLSSNSTTRWTTPALPVQARPGLRPQHVPELPVPRSTSFITPTDAVDTHTATLSMAQPTTVRSRIPAAVAWIVAGIFLMTTIVVGTPRVSAEFIHQPMASSRRKGSFKIGQGTLGRGFLNVSGLESEKRRPQPGRSIARNGQCQTEGPCTAGEGKIDHRSTRISGNDSQGSYPELEQPSLRRNQHTEESARAAGDRTVDHCIFGLSDLSPQQSGWEPEQPALCRHRSPEENVRSAGCRPVDYRYLEFSDLGLQPRGPEPRPFPTVAKVKERPAGAGDR